MMKQSTAVLALAGVLAFNAAQAATNTTSTTASEVLPSIKEKLSIPFSSTLYGPSAAGMAKGDFTKTPKEADIGPSTAENILGVYYKATPKVTIGPVARVFARTDAAKPFIIDNPWIRAKHSSVVSAGNFNLAADLRLYLPLANNSYIAGLRSTQVGEYQLPNTRWTAGWVSLVRVNALAGDSPTYSALVEPTLNYQISPKIAATFLADIVQLSVTRADGVVNAPANVQGGVNFDITPSFSVNPRLVVFPGAADVVGASSLWVDITWVLL